MNNSEKKNNGDSKKIYSLLVLIAIVMVTTTGGTYAYLALSATATNKPTGTVASGNLTFSAEPSIVSPNTTYASKPMVPQYAYNNSKNVLQLAVTGGKPNGSSSAVPCVDDNGNVICKVYTFTIKNSSSANVVVDGKIKFTSPSTNLKWAKMKSATAVTISSATDSKIHNAMDAKDKEVLFTDASDNSSTTTTPSLKLSAGATKQYWIVFWIQEFGGTTAQTDSGTWNATISFTSSNGTGITSTITG